MKVLALLSLLLATTSAEWLSRCAVVDAVRNSKLVDNDLYSVGDWVCMAYMESGYNTNDVTYDRKGSGLIWSGNYGIFQINSYWWCNVPGLPNAGNTCGVHCRDLFDLQASIDCAALVVVQQGMEAC
ncbi:lysozyme C, tracheal isozyme-like [Rhinoraja longicauda]